MKFSVVIPTYNQAGLLKKALVSLKQQSYKNFEVVIINNFSEDDTLNVIHSASLENLTLLNYNNNGSIAAARNKGVENSTGEYVCFLDSDDEWYPDKLKRAYDVIRKSSCEIYTHAEKWIYDSGSEKSVLYGPDKKFSARNLIFRANCLSTSAVTISKKLFCKLGGFNESHDLILAEDYELWIRASLSGASCHFDRSIQGVYRVHSEGNSQKLGQHRRSQLAVLAFHKKSIRLSSLEYYWHCGYRVGRIYVGSFLRYFTQ